MDDPLRAGVGNDTITVLGAGCWVAGTGRRALTVAWTGARQLGRSKWCCAHRCAAAGFRYADATYYSAKSGAGVFNAGAMNWVYTLDGRNGHRTRTRLQQNHHQPAARLRPPTGRAHRPARDTAGNYYAALPR